MTTKKVAQAIQVPSFTYRDSEMGKEIKGERYMRISRVFNVSLGCLLTGKNPDERENHLFLIERLNRDRIDLKNSIQGRGRE